MNIAQSLSEGVSPVIRALLGIVLVGAILVLISWAAPVISPIMVAGFVAALVAPLYFWLERRGVSSGLAVILLVWWSVEEAVPTLLMENVTDPATIPWRWFSRAVMLVMFAGGLLLIRKAWERREAS